MMKYLDRAELAALLHVAASEYVREGTLRQHMVDFVTLVESRPYEFASFRRESRQSLPCGEVGKHGIHQFEPSLLPQDYPDSGSRATRSHSQQDWPGKPPWPENVEGTALHIQ